MQAEQQAQQLPTVTWCEGWCMESAELWMTHTHTQRRTYRKDFAAHFQNASARSVGAATAASAESKYCQSAVARRQSSDDEWHLNVGLRSCGLSGCTSIRVIKGCDNAIIHRENTEPVIYLPAAKRVLSRQHEWWIMSTVLMVQPRGHTGALVQGLKMSNI